MDVVPSAECLSHLPTSTAEVVLVDDEQRSAILRGQVRHGHAGDAHHAVLAATQVARPDLGRQRQHLVRAQWARGHIAVVDLLGMPRSGGMCVHIRSGALTPRIASPLAIT